MPAFHPGLNKILLLFSLLIWVAQPIYAQDDNAISDESEEALEIIAISDIPAQSAEVLKTINSKYKPAVEDSVIQDIAPVTDTLRLGMNEVIALTQYAIDQKFPADISESFISKWDDLIRKIDGPIDEISTYTKRLEEIHDEINKTRELWNLTAMEFESDEQASLEASNRVRFVLDELSKIEREVNDRLNLALDQQNRLIDLKLEATDRMKSQKSFLQKELGTLLSEQSEYLWQMQKDSASADRKKEGSEFYYAYNRSEAKRYLHENPLKFIYIAAILMGFLLLLYLMKAKLEEFDRFEPSIADIGRGIFKRPIFAALFLASISSIPILMGSPTFVGLSLVFVIVVSFIFLIPVTIHKNFRVAVYAFTLIYILFLFQDLILLGDYNYRINQLIFSLILIAFFWWFRRKQSMFAVASEPKSIWFGLLKIISPIFLVILVGGLLANFIGYLYFSYLISETVVRSFFIAIVFGFVYTTFKAVFTLFLFTPLAETSNLILKHRDWLIKRAKVLFQFFFIILWLRFTLDSLHLLAPTINLFDDIKAVGVDLDDFELTIGSFVNFGVIIFSAWLISNMVRLLLQDEILSRFPMAKGIPMAIASLTYYTLMVIGLIMALIALGFDITHLSVLAGALGIGIGFGLQNVVNNFISGLILIFERPITVGDIVNLQSIEGKVISIGIRSSKVEQYDGSVLIVPNADLISHQVVNFTLTNDRRRFILPIYTDSNANPEKVLELMNEAAGRVPEVLPNPPARSYFTGTEDQSRVFKLYFWVAGTVFLKAKSDVTLAVHRLLSENGIEVKTHKEITLQQAKK